MNLMKSPKNRKPLFERLKTGLEEAILHTRGEITLKTTTLEMPDRPSDVRTDELTKLRLESGMSQAVFAGAQRLDQDCPELGTGLSKAVVGRVKADPSVPAESVRRASDRWHVGWNRGHGQRKEGGERSRGGRGVVTE